MKARAVDFVGIAVSDMDAAKDFYGNTLGLPQTGGFGDGWAEFDAGNVTLALIKGEADAIAKRIEAGPWAAIGVALAVPDVKAAIEELRGKGVRVETDTADYPPCFIATIQDPTGNYVWLHQRKDGSAG